MIIHHIAMARVLSTSSSPAGALGASPATLASLCVKMLGIMLECACDNQKPVFQQSRSATAAPRENAAAL